MDADVGVIGVGTIGAMALWRLQRSGIKAVGLEQYNPGNSFGGSAGGTRYYRTAYTEGRLYFPLLQSARELWSSLQALSSNQYIWNCGLLTIGPETDPRLVGAQSFAKEFELDHEILSAPEAARRYPQHRYRDDDLVFLDPLAGLISSDLSVVHAASTSESLGAKIYRRAKVERLEEEHDCVTVFCGERIFRFGKIVVTTGAWICELVPEIREFLEPKRSWQTWYVADKADCFTKDVFPPFGRTLDGTRFHGAPTSDGQTVCISAVRELPEIITKDQRLERTSLPDLERVNAFVRTAFNDIHPDPVRILPSLDGYTQDDHPIIGMFPGSDRIIVMGGFSGHGFKLAPVMGEIAADLVKRGGTDHPIAHMDIGRFLKGNQRPKNTNMDWERSQREEVSPTS